MPKPKPKIIRTHRTKEVSVMAWIEDEDQKVLLVRQALGLRLWTLPGGKVKRGESLDHPPNTFGRPGEAR